jgi:hypothetical protein
MSKALMQMPTKCPIPPHCRLQAIVALHTVKNPISTHQKHQVKHMMTMYLMGARWVRAICRYTVTCDDAAAILVNSKGFLRCEHCTQLLCREHNLPGPPCGPSCCLRPHPCCSRCRLCDMHGGCTDRVLWRQHPEKSLFCCPDCGDCRPAVGRYSRVATLPCEAEACVPGEQQAGLQ